MRSSSSGKNSQVSAERPVDRRGRVGHPFGPGQTERDGDHHGRRAGLHQRRTIDELDHRVHHAGGVDDDVDAVERDTEQQVGLDHFKSFVNQSRGVDGDDWPHVPGRMFQRLSDRDVTEIVATSAPEWTTAGGQHQPSYLLRRAASEALRQRAVLGVDRHDLTGLRAVEDQRAAHDQGLLVGQREGRAGVECGQRRTQTDRPRDPVEDDVAGHRRGLGGGLLSEAVERGRELRHLLLEQVGGGSAGRQAHHPEPVGVGAHQVEGLGPDGARRSEHHDVARGHRPILAAGPSPRVAQVARGSPRVRSSSLARSACTRGSSVSA